MFMLKFSDSVSDSDGVSDGARRFRSQVSGLDVKDMIYNTDYCIV